jgi:hypothetical protein
VGSFHVRGLNWFKLHQRSSLMRGEEKSNWQIHPLQAVPAGSALSCF